MAGDTCRVTIIQPAYPNVTSQQSLPPDSSSQCSGTSAARYHRVLVVDTDMAAGALIGQWVKNTGSRHMQGYWTVSNTNITDTVQHCTMRLTLHSFSLKLCITTLDLKT